MVTQSGSSRPYDDGSGRLTAEGQRVVADHYNFALKLASVFKAEHPRRADEIESLAMAKLVDATVSFEPEQGASFKTWAYRKIRWAIWDWIKSERRRNRGRWNDPEHLEGIPDQGPPACNRIEAIEAKDLAKDRVDKLLGQINPSQARAVRMVKLDGKGYAESAAELGIVEDTFRKQCSRGLQMLEKLAK